MSGRFAFWALSVMGSFICTVGSAFMETESLMTVGSSCASVMQTVAIVTTMLHTTKQLKYFKQCLLGGNVCR